jgi:hypothetical protein
MHVDPFAMQLVGRAIPSSAFHDPIARGELIRSPTVQLNELRASKYALKSTKTAAPDGGH